MYTRICLTFSLTQNWMRVGNIIMSFKNDSACLELYKEAFKNKVQDFIISFNEEQTSIENVLQVTSNLFRQLINSYDNSRIYARLVAKVKFIHFNSLNEETEERVYHFPSYTYEYVFDTEEFYERHMQKIASRLETFNRNGSNLLIKNIEHLHICLQKQPLCKVDDNV